MGLFARGFSARNRRIIIARGGCQRGARLRTRHSSEGKRMAIAALDLGDLEWSLEGWRQWGWKLIRTIEAPAVRRPDIGPVRAKVPGSVRGALVSSGVVADPYHGVQSREY